MMMPRSLQAHIDKVCTKNPDGSSAERYHTNCKKRIPREEYEGHCSTCLPEEKTSDQPSKGRGRPPKLTYDERIAIKSDQIKELERYILQTEERVKKLNSQPQGVEGAGSKLGRPRVRTIQEEIDQCQSDIVRYRESIVSKEKERDRLTKLKSQ
jgi:hypothetical protein